MGKVAEQAAENAISVVPVINRLTVRPLQVQTEVEREPTPIIRHQFVINQLN